MDVHRLKLKSNPGCLKTVKQWLDEIAIKYGVCESLYPDILISLTEAVNNAIYHGNRGDEQKRIVVVCKVKKNKLKFEVHDQGEGFNPDEVPDPRTGDRVETENGRGVLIMKSLAHKVRFKRKGTLVEMTFKYKSH